MPHRQTREAHADIGAGAADHEAGLAGIVLAHDRDVVESAAISFEQALELARLGIVAQAGDQLDRLLDVDQIGLELLRQVGVEHGGYSGTGNKTARDGSKSIPGRIGRPHKGEGTGALDLADEVERRSERLFALFPLRRADFARMRGNVLRGLDLAEQLGGVAADAFRR